MICRIVRIQAEILPNTVRNPAWRSLSAFLVHALEQGDTREESWERLKYDAAHLQPESQQNDQAILVNHAAGFWDGFDGKNSRGMS